MEDRASPIPSEVDIDEVLYLVMGPCSVYAGEEFSLSVGTDQEFGANDIVKVKRRDVDKGAFEGPELVESQTGSFYFKPLVAQLLGYQWIDFYLMVNNKPVSRLCVQVEVLSRDAPSWQEVWAQRMAQWSLDDD